MNILVIDDNSTIRTNIREYLASQGYRVDMASGGEEAFSLILSGSYDFLVVDRMMPGIDGMSLIRMLNSRSIEIPFLFLTALGKQIDKIEGLSLGADDYLVKPFDLQELALRIDNILARSGKSSRTSGGPITIGDIVVDIEAQVVKKNGTIIALSPKEFAIFAQLLLSRGRVISRGDLYSEVWGEYDPSDDVLDTINVHVAYIRKKLGTNIIRTVKLAGYIIDLS